ncbi:hypothetical protein [Mesorhizobium sp. CN2-181]|uniref:hypothetical protein n=1 Tax=Mesorhizobium yinganensis TaxID=3157707 RepID=UPI0032B74C8C
MTTISLDRKALHSLLDADPDFALDLKKNVLAEVGRRFFEKDAKRVIAAAEPELFAQALKGVQNDHELMEQIKKALSTSIVTKDTNYYNRLKLTDEVMKLINDQVIMMKNRAIQSALDAVTMDIAGRIQEAVTKSLEVVSIDERIQKRVDRLTEEYIKSRAEELFKARMADIKAMMG